MLPASCVVQPRHIHVGEFGWRGGFADVGKGEYRGRTVAVKHLRTGTGDDFEKVFKVSNRSRLNVQQSLTLNQATLSRSPHLEAVVSSEYPASVGRFCVKASPAFPHHIRVDAQRKRDGVRKIQSTGQPFTLGEYPPTYASCNVLYLYSFTARSFPK